MLSREISALKDQFIQTLKDIDPNASEELFYDFCRKNVLHGTPEVFKNKEDQYYEFRKRISKKFDIPYHEVYITGSAKLGFSIYKDKIFDLDSDIDVTIISQKLFDEISLIVLDYQMALRANRTVTDRAEIKNYHKFLEYMALGWIRPDLLPYSFQVDQIKDSWFDFFNSLSYGKSEVGNYKVSAGIFKSHYHIETYLTAGLIALNKQLNLG